MGGSSIYCCSSPDAAFKDAQLVTLFEVDCKYVEPEDSVWRGTACEISEIQKNELGWLLGVCAFPFVLCFV